MVVVLVAAGWAGCGGVTQRDVAAPVGAERGAVAPARARGTIRIERVENKTDRAECDDLAHYVHLKAAQLLESQGWSVLTDDWLAQAEFLALPAVIGAPAEPGRSLRIELTRAEEKAGATVSVGIFSRQGQTATVDVRVRLRETATGREAVQQATGNGVKGAWGVLAKVNREALLRREGFWQFDRSLLGGAATEALAQALSSFP